jgi:hypothetical protein
MITKRIAQIGVGLLLISVSALAQETDTDNWDNLLFVGTRTAYAKGDWRFSGEFQTRFKNDWGALDNWFVEGVVTFLPSKNWEVVPDFRLTRKPSAIEFRPGMGMLLKILSPHFQVVNQFKYQADISTNGKTKQSLRQVLFLNKLLNQKLVSTLVGGYFYTWKENFSAIEYIRFGGGVTFTFDQVHAMTIIYYAGLQNTGERWLATGSLFLQLTINLKSEWKYVPAKYINF